mgnify:CR=1 FL=1
MAEADLTSIYEETTKNLSEALSEVLEAAAADIQDGCRRIVEIGLQAVMEGVPMAREVMQDQLRARLNVHAIRANAAAWALAAKIATLVLTSVGHAIVSLA